MNRCEAIKANGSQCTRTKQQDNKYCGTHVLHTPADNLSHDQTTQATKKIEIWLENINGIYYYVDASHNGYTYENIQNGINTPTFKWGFDEDGNICKVI